MTMALFCPHCGGELPAHDDRRGGRCPACRLVVGSGRARDTPLADVRTGGFVANAARREDAEPVAEEDAFGALSAVAASVGCGVERLRMTDYDRAVRGGADGPSVARVLATFTTWKAARAAAGAGHVRQRLAAATSAADAPRSASGSGSR
jgi:hypothetical protein